MALSCAQVQYSWGENGNTDAADTGGEKATQHGPDMGTAPGDKALQDRYTHIELDFLPGLPGLPAMQLSVCLQDWWKVFGSDCCLPGVPPWPMGSAYSW